jgi:hypothetical protein
MLTNDPLRSLLTGSSGGALRARLTGSSGGVPLSGDWPLTEQDLHVAARNIGVMADHELDKRLAQMHERRRHRNDLAQVRDYADLEATELEEAAYQLAGEHRARGHLEAAARWYLAAAKSDFADAALCLAEVLDELAKAYGTSPATRTNLRKEMDLVSDAARWYAAAYAAGHDEDAADKLEALLKRANPDRPAASPEPEERQAEDAEPSQLACAVGGLRKVLQTCDLTAGTSHFASCHSCQQELLELGGVLPTTRKSAPLTLPPSTLNQNKNQPGLP